MDYSCPRCGQSLNSAPFKSVPRPGQRRFLPLLTDRACPNCDARLRLNTHPTERTLRQFDAVLLLGCAAFAYFAGQPKVFFGIGVGVSSLVELFLWAWGRRHWRQWKRYELAG